jgi:AcrR family transcriptional regulator
LLRAAAELLDEAQGREVSTRAVCDRAGVRAPTLYHHFGSKDGLLHAVVEYGVHQYAAEESGDNGGDPVAQLRKGWNDHVRFGLANPSFYVLLYGRIKPGVPCAVTAVAERRLAVLLRRIGELGMLDTSCEDAARQVVSANVGVTLYLIGRDESDREMGLSDRLCASVLAGVLKEYAGSGFPGLDGRSPRRVDHAIADAAANLSTALRDSDGGGALTRGEATLLTELLQRLASKR